MYLIYSAMVQGPMIKRRLQALKGLGFSAEAIVSMLSRVPSLLGYQSKGFNAIGEYLTGLGGLSKADVDALVQKDPRVLTYSITGKAASNEDMEFSLEPCCDLGIVQKDHACHVVIKFWPWHTLLVRHMKVSQWTRGTLLPAGILNIIQFLRGLGFKVLLRHHSQATAADLALASSVS